MTNMKSRTLSAVQMRRFLQDARRWKVVDASMEPHEHYLDISPATALSVAAARCFYAEIGGADGYWDNLRRLSSSVASVLVRHQPQSLSLAGIATIGPATAATLASHAGWLGLAGLKHLTPGVAAALSRQRGVLHLGVERLSVSAARALARHRGRELQLPTLRELSAPVAKALAQYRGSLYLPVITSVTTEAAAALAQHRGPKISMARLRVAPKQDIRLLIEKLEASRT